MTESNSTLPEVEGVVFKTISRYPGYAFGSDGSVWTQRKRYGKGVKLGEWRILGFIICKQTGYKVSHICENGGAIRKLAHQHRLILEAFAGPAPEGMECCHENDIPTDNRIDNLRWDTPQGNATDRIKNGRVPTGEAHKKAKLTEDKVREIRRRFAAGEQPVDLGKRFGVTNGCIWHVVKGLTWVKVK